MHATLRLGHARASVLSTVYPFVGGYLGAPRLHCGPGNGFTCRIRGPFVGELAGRINPRQSVTPEIGPDFLRELVCCGAGRRLPAAGSRCNMLGSRAPVAQRIERRTTNP